MHPTGIYDFTTGKFLPPTWLRTQHWYFEPASVNLYAHNGYANLTPTHTRSLDVTTLEQLWLVHRYLQQTFIHVDLQSAFVFIGCMGMGWHQTKSSIQGGGEGIQMHLLLFYQDRSPNSNHTKTVWHGTEYAEWKVLSPFPPKYYSHHDSTCEMQLCS